VQEGGQAAGAPCARMGGILGNVPISNSKTRAPGSQHRNLGHPATNPSACRKYRDGSIPLDHLKVTVPPLAVRVTELSRFSKPQE